MSIALNPISPKNTTTIHSLNINNTEQNGDKTNNKVVDKLEENTHVLNSNLIEKLDKKSSDEEKEDETQVKRDCFGCKEQEVDNNKVDEDLSKWEQQTLGSMIIGTSADVEGNKTAKLEILNLTVVSPGRKDNIIEVPFGNTSSKSTLFTLKEGSKYRILFHFKVSNTLVNALTYSYAVWKAGIKVNQTKKMVGTFSPREEPYTFESSEGTTPSGFFARGPFLVKSKFMDDEGNCYMDTSYYFDIRKDWGANDK